MMPGGKLDAKAETDYARDKKDEKPSDKPKYPIGNIPTAVWLPATTSLVINHRRSMSKGGEPPIQNYE
jgi:hypothetical protein